VANDREPHAQDFRCPICGGNRFVKVDAMGSGNEHKEQKRFFRCAGCNFGFTDPAMFGRRRPKVG
jgi:hypothetical protein